MIDDSRIAHILSAEAASAVSDWQSEVGREQSRALRYYQGEPYEGDEDEEMATWSKVVSRDVAEVVDWALPEIVKLFVSMDRVGDFKPRRPDQEDAAEQASEYVNHILFEDNDGFEILHDQIKDGLLQKVGVVRVYWDDRAEATRETIDGLDIQGASTLAAESEVGDAEITILGVEETDLGISVRIERRDGGRARVECIPPENFLLSTRGSDPDKVPYIASRFRKTLSELVGDGFSKKEVYNLSDEGQTPAEYTGEYQRHKEDHQIGQDDNEDPSQREVWVYDEYARVDVDEDGEAELIHATRVGNTILKWEEVSEQPFVVFTPNRMPHRVIGRALADDVLDVQDIKTALWRDGLDNLALANRPQREVPDSAVTEDGSTIEDLLNPRIGGIVRTRAPNLIRDIIAPDVSGGVLSMIEYTDRVREQRTGVSRYNQGLEGDTLHETKGGVDRIFEAGQARRDLIARLYAKSLKLICEKVYRTICRNQDRERVIKLRDNWVPMDPRAWDSAMKYRVDVGLGTSSAGEKRENAGILVQTQREGFAAGFVTPEQMYNGLEKFTETLGLGPVEEFFTPAQPQQPGEDPEMAAKQQELQVKVQEMQVKAQLEAQTAAQRLEMDREIANQEMQLKRELAERDFQLKREEMAAQIELKKLEISMTGQTNENIPTPVE